MIRGTGIGRTEEEARERAIDALKDRLWEEVWKDEIQLPVKREKVDEEDGIFVVTVDIW